MNHSNKPKEYGPSIFHELIKAGRIKMVKRVINSIPFSKELKERVKNTLDTKTPEEIAKLELEAAEALDLAKKAVEPTWWHYVVVRKELSGGPLLAQVGHATGYSAAQLGAPLPARTRICVLQATKEEFGEAYGKLILRSDEVGKTLYAMYESEGKLAGCYTAMAFLTSDKQSIIDVVGDLKLWTEKPKVVITGNTVGGDIAGGNINK